MGKSEQEQEGERLAALHSYRVLDTPREPAFDEIAAVAALLCKAPVSAINFVDEVRQWTKAAVGVETLTMPADLSICMHTIRQKDVLIITDIATDSRLGALLTAVAQPQPRFYAGIPMETSEGHAIGTLCVLDVKPRELTADQNAVLRMLARHAMTELELRNALQAERDARLEAERLLAEKETLLARNDVLMREIDHRVKNSLQVVASMLGLQARRMPDSAAAQALEEAQRRISGIAAIHDQLYRVSDTDRVDMRGLLQGMCASLGANRPDTVDKVIVEAAPIVVNSKRAMKIGLLVNELVTNAFKHAYSSEQRGDVHVTLAADGQTLRLVVSDAGVGVPDDICIDKGKGLGMRLIRSVLEQCGGVMDIGKGPGAKFIIKVPGAPSNEH
jgi:two-component sensor histidine kinase